MFVTVNPLKPKRLTGHFQICDISNISSWDAIQEKIQQVSIAGILPGATGNYIEFTYENLSDNSFILCKFNIPEIVLYKASTINVVYKLNQPAQLAIGIHRVGQGPFWEPVIINSDSVNKKITSTWTIDKDQGNEPKLNWLSGPYEEVIFRVSESDRAKPLVLTIYEVYLE